MDSDDEISDESKDLVYKLPDTITMIYLAIIFTFILTAIFTTMNWITYRRQMVQVERLLGFQNREIIFSVFSKYLPVFVSASISSFLIIMIFNLVSDIFHPQWFDVFVAMLLMFISGVVILSIYLIPILKSKKVELKR